MRERFYVPVSIAILVVLLTGCDAGEPESAATVAVYRHATDGAPDSLDPVRAATVYANMAVVNLFDTLYRYRYLERPYRLTPNLAVDFPEVSDDGLRYVFRIRAGARFADDPAFPGGQGRIVTAHDLVYSLKRHFDPASRSQGAWLWTDRIVGLDEWGRQGADYDAQVAGLRALDDTTVQITLTAPYPQLIYTLATGFSALVPREAVARYGPEFGVKPVGSGPFRLVRFDSTLARFEPNPNFERPPLDLAEEGFDPRRHAGLGLEVLDGRRYPFLDVLEIHFIAENAARWSAFASGAVDNVRVPNAQIGRVLSSRDPIVLAPAFESEFHARAGQEAGFIFGGFNMADERFGHHPDAARDAANRALRCAIRDVYDWQARNETFHYGIGRVFPGVIPPIVPEFDADLPQGSVEHDPARARERLSAAGWTAESLPVLTYGMPAGVQQRQMYEQFRAGMLALGYPPDKLRVETFATFGDFARAMKTRQLDLFFLGWALDYPDAQNTLQLFYGPYETPGSNNLNYRNNEFDRLYEAAVAMQPGSERTALYQRMNRIVIDDCVAIGGLSRTFIHLWGRHLAMWPDEEMLNGFFMRFVAERVEG